MLNSRYKGGGSTKADKIKMPLFLTYFQKYNLKKGFLLLHFCVFLLLNNTPISAQILDNTNCDIFTNNNFFNPEFVFQNKIKSIYATISLKKEMKPIKQTGLIQQYKFDYKGRLIKMMETEFVKGGKKDTALTQFYYTEDKLTKKLMSDSKGFFSYTYDYNENNKIIKLTYAREVNANSSKKSFKSKQKIIIFSENYTYLKLSDTELRKTILNKQDKPYKRIVYKSDRFGNLISENSRLIVTRKSASINYKYDEFHRPIEKIDVTNITGKNELKYEYEYDEVGNILEERIYNNGIHKTTRQFLYDERMLLSALLTKNESTKTIQIIKFKYRFY